MPTNVRTALLTASSLLALGGALVAQTVVLDQPPPSGGVVLVANPPPISISDSGCGAGSARAFADDFAVSAAVDVNVAMWQGLYQALDDAVPAPPTPFTLMIHQDSGNLPGPVVATRSLAAGRSLLFSGMVLSQPRAVYAYVASFPAIHLEPGVYWVELFETDGRSDLCFIWQTGALDATRGRDGNAYSDSAPGATWSAILRADDNLDNRQITLVSQPAVVDVPTLGGWGLVALGGSLFAVGLRRARVRR